MDYVKIRTHVVAHERFLLAGAEARDLWTWSMLYSGQLESDGEIPTVAIMTSPWGAGGAKNAKVAEKLVEVGLWARTPNGFRILRWAEQGNVTRADLDAKRAAARERMKARRGSRTSDPPSPPESCSRELRANFARSSPNVRVCTSPSTYSSSGSSGEVQEGARLIRLDEPLTDERRGVIDTNAMNTGVTLDPEREWALFIADRREKGILIEPDRITDSWRKWVIRGVSYARKDRERERSRPTRANAQTEEGVYLVPVEVLA